VGEIISAVVMASYIEAQGVKAEAMTGFQAGISGQQRISVIADIIKVDPAPIKKNIEGGKNRCSCRLSRYNGKRRNYHAGARR